ncbi:MAG TPA: HEAT repeat domain-containing protein [Pirellulaceae bacterium]|nr:HEAT repeat domain-containing protein [Pirellulaceae bacterium]HMO94071.1 HEAT repeat domain-containing protein [Pirellulaceae bacterium]HMP70921.1 HEAT repeat domain-containing protein [Pirellulaceae bacterium]
MTLPIPQHTVAQDRSDDDNQTELTAREIIARFQNEWVENKWEKEFRVTPEKYMRATDDKQWQQRFSAFRQLVSLGEHAVPDLLEALNSDQAPVRILAAQTIGFLGNHETDAATLEALLHSAKSDANATVRLYAIDSYGMLGGSAESIKPLADVETNRDVKMHIKYALERNGERFSDEWIARLGEMDSADIDSAVINQPAPEFTLVSVTGETISLQDFRDKSHVILVFIYGDT